MSVKKTSQTLSMRLLDPAQAIINEFEPMTFDEEYVFPVLSSRHNTPQKIDNRQKKILREFNQDLKVLGEMANIEIPLTSYVARHTYATVLKRSGVSTSKISESMGHRSEEITQSYLDSFANDVLDDADLNLL